MRICLYTETALPKVGGQELVVDALAREHAALGHDVVVLAARPKRKEPLNDENRPYAVMRHPAFYSTRWGVAWYRRYLLKLHRQHHFDAVHCHSVYPTGYLAALCRPEWDAATVITSHGGDVREGNVRLQKKGLPQRHTQAVQSADALAAISGFTREGYLRLGGEPGQIVEIPNGVDLAQFNRQPARPQRLGSEVRAGRFLLFLGRLHERKGVDVLLRALASLRAPGDGRIDLLIAGDGPQREPLEALARELQLTSRVLFVGPVAGDEKVWLLKHARAVVLPTRHWEAFPLVVLESYAAGRPVIGTRAPGLADKIIESQTGWLAEPDDAASLARAIQPALAEPRTADAYGEMARRYAASFSWRAVAQRYLELFADLADRRRLTRAA